MNQPPSLERGRDLYAQRVWGEAYAQLSAADAESPLGSDDLERLALAAFMSGKDYECAQAWTRAHHAWIRAGDLRRAARCALWQAAGLGVRGEMAPFSGWIERARRVLDEYGEPCPEMAWVRVFDAVPAMFSGDAAGALPSFIEACEIAERFNDPDVMMYARLSRGHSLVMLNQTEQGLALLDEVMVSVTTGEVSPIASGLAYCQVIATCQEMFDLRRAREWTQAFSRWCEEQGGLIAYRGSCLVDRCEVLRLQGNWPEAMELASNACKLLSNPDWDTLGAAHYQLGEIERLRGELTAAEESYRRASQAGQNPEPGMSLLRLAQGRVDAASASIRRVLEEAGSALARYRLLPAYTEIMLAVGDVPAARAAADELLASAREMDAPFLHALAASASGAVLLAEGDAKGALASLRDSCRRWQELRAPYEAARVRVVLARALQSLGDDEGAQLELDGARWALEQLGATADLAVFDAGGRTASDAAPGGLTAREIEVLGLLAAGRTNKEIATTLVISEHTAARHVQHILGKLGVASRSAAVAFAFEHNLVVPLG